MRFPNLTTKNVQKRDKAASANVIWKTLRQNKLTHLPFQRPKNQPTPRKRRAEAPQFPSEEIKTTTAKKRMGEIAPGDTTCSLPRSSHREVAVRSRKQKWFEPKYETSSGHRRGWFLHSPTFVGMRAERGGTGGSAPDRSEHPMLPGFPRRDARRCRGDRTRPNLIGAPRVCHPLVNYFNNREDRDRDLRSAKTPVLELKRWNKWRLILTFDSRFKWCEFIVPRLTPKYFCLSIFLKYCVFYVLYIHTDC